MTTPQAREVAALLIASLIAEAGAIWCRIRPGACQHGMSS